MQYKLDTKKPHIICLILLIGFPSAVAVLISPALPVISDFFKISNAFTQQLVTIFIVGYALGQLIYPPFANRFGRKIAIYIGIILYLIGSLICLLGSYFPSIEAIILGRLFQGLGSSVGMVICFTIINDFYHPEQARPIASYAVLAYAFMPALAVTIGGLLTSHLSWIGCFYFYLIYGFIILLSSSYLPETMPTINIQALKIKSLFNSFYSGFCAWRLIIFSCMYGLFSAFIYILASRGPFIGIDKIGLTPAWYGLLLLIPYSGQFFSALISGSLNKKLFAYQVITLGYSFVIFGSVFMFISFIFHWIDIISFMLPIFLIMIGLPMIYSNVTIMALVDYEDKATGSAIMGFITISITVIATFITTLFTSEAPVIMPASFIILLILAIIAFWYAINHFNDKN